MVYPRGPHLHPIPGILASAQMSAPAPGGGGYGWAPDDIAGLVFWWRSDAGLVLSGSDISTFGDQSGNGNDGAWTGARAGLESNVTGSLPAARFNGAPLYQLPNNCLSGLTSAQVFAAIKCDADVPADALDTGLWRFGTDAFATHYPFTDGNVYDDFGSSSRFTIGNTVADKSAWHRLCVKAESSGYQAWINNTSEFSNATSCGSSWQADPLFGGENVGLDEYRFNGYLLEIFMYDSVLSSGDRGQVDQYLSDRIDGTWYAAENP
jgi:hypothetical protein